MSGFEGADPDALDRLGNQTKAAADALSFLGTTMTNRLFTASWTGSGAENFRSQWQTAHMAAIRAAVQGLLDAGASLHANAAQQRGASSASGIPANFVPSGSAGGSAFGPPTPQMVDHANREKLQSDINSLEQTRADKTAELEKIMQQDAAAAEDHLHHEGWLGQQWQFVQWGFSDVTGSPPWLSDPRVQQLMGELDQNSKQLQQLQGLQSALSGDPPRYLLEFDTGGPNGGHAAVSIGDPSTANNVTTFVPGFGSKIGGIGGDMGYAQNIYNAASGISGSKTNAVVVWLGYNAPQGTDVTNPGDAQAGASALSSFLYNQKQANPDANYTVEGHSYGSVVVGWASQQPEGLSANNVILVGSPGVPVTSASGFGVPDGHVFAGEMAGDPVPDAGHLVQTPQGWMGPLGFDPVDLPGVVHFSTGGPDFNPKDYLPGFDFGQHSKYWDDGPSGPSVSLENQAKIITGQGQPSTS